MVGLLYRVPVYFKARNVPGWQYLYKVNKVLLNKLYPLCHKRDKHMGIDKNGKLIVSLTSFPARIEFVWMTIHSLMNQTLKPKKIILWLSQEQYQTEESIPQSLRALKKRGLEIRFCEDIKPHKKYYHTMQEYPDDIVVTVDDDIFYPENHLEMLWKKHLEYPDAVCCWFAHKIKFDEQGNIKKYKEWESGVSGCTVPTIQIMAVGCGGVLYPPHKLSERLFSIKDITELCPVTDDIWLKAMEVVNGVKVVRCVEESQVFFGFLETRKNGLFTENANRDGNDTAIAAIAGRFPGIWKLYEKN